jgi:hypothetical protein
MEEEREKKEEREGEKETQREKEVWILDAYC